MKKAELTDTFMFYWRALGDETEAIREHRGIVKRYTKQGKAIKTNHRFDVAFPSERVFVELEGGVLSGGRHVRGYGYHNDCLKYNMAVLQGWVHLRYTGVDLDNDPHSIVAEIKQLLAMKRANPPVESERVWTAAQSNYGQRRMKQPRRKKRRRAKSRR